MENNRKMVPKRRFKEFQNAGDWEQRKLGDIFIEYSEKNHTELPPLTIVQGKGTIRRDESDRQLQFDESGLSSYKMVDKDDFIVHLRSFEGGLEKANSVGIVSPAYHIFHGVDIDPRLYYEYFRSYYFIKVQLIPHVYGIRDGRSIDIEGMKSIKIPYTNLNEQKRIGDSINELNKHITLHQRKLDKMKAIKKAYLSEMFPQNGEKQPRRRFKGFTDDWEQRKLGDVGKTHSGVGFPDTEQGGIIGVPFFKVSDMNLDGNENEMTVANNYVTAEQVTEHRWSPITELPAIFFAKVGAAVMLNRKRLCRFPFLLDNNTMAYSLSPTKWDADFAKALFGTVDLTSLVQVGALPSYNAGDVESMEVYLPSLLEQVHIGAFFKQLDNLITLHQRKLEKLKNIKKAYLNEMFV